MPEITRVIKGTKFTLFSLESARSGGFSKSDAIAMLKERGIKVSGHDTYTPFMGHYGLWVESARAEEAEDIFWG